MLIGGEVLQTILRYAENAVEGCFVEVGVYQGDTAAHLAEIAKRQNRQLYLYDTFTGIPCQGEYDAHKVGDFSDTSEELVRAKVPSSVICTGLFPETLIPMPLIAFAHIDCDQYQSVKDCITHLSPLMAKGGVMLFDDYNCLDGATRAVREAFKDVQETPQHKAVVTF